LYLGGVGLARGYLNRPAATAEKFVPNCFSTEPGERLYRTGDLARWLADGTLEFLGRMDHQVKVRGYRIELGEIESALRAHEQVRDAVVVAREEVSGTRRLVGYVVADFAQVDEAALVNELRGRLQEQLPGYMVPSTLVVLESLPLTANGKIDRKALPEPDASVSESQFVPPEGDIERTLAHLWQELLRVEQVGRRDSFFELGGHSLLAMQLATRIEQEFGIEIAIRTLFQYHALEAMASRIEMEVEIDGLDDDALNLLSEEEAAEILKEWQPSL
jgi:acyl carrier protein